jgi:hypothetical protein
MTAEAAEGELQYKPAGTFLIRTSTKPGHFAVSYVAENGSVQKTLIATSPKYFVVNSPERGKFNTLQELVEVCRHI